MGKNSTYEVDPGKAIDFSPKSLETFEYRPSPSCLEKVAYAEQGLARLDERLRFHEYSDIVSGYLMDLDAVASGRISGERVSLRDLFFWHFFLTLSNANKEIPEFIEINRPDLSASYVEGYRKSLSFLKAHKGEMDLAFLLEVYEGLLPASDKSGLRTSGVSFGESGQKGIDLYEPARPDEVALLLKNLLDFCTVSYSTPLVQTALAHFRFEAIYPFENGSDYMGRLLSHAVIMNRGLESHVVVPIGMYAAIHVAMHSNNLFPYKAKRQQSQHFVNRAVEDFLNGCCVCADYAVSISLKLIGEIQKITKRWDSMLGRVRPDSALKIVMHAILAMPIFNADYLVAATGRSSTAVNTAINQLIRSGVARQISTGKRNRLFEAPDIIALFDWIETSMFPDDAPCRDDFSYQSVSFQNG
ncbi:Fic family protein [Raoultibacter phocaeensis]|uniref:Fic family protein n=1 Tax=Raoultibacter phocaeensis TaxID=2479841 RepID=UPI0015D63D4A|nr:Fic family protein [Raoultibacter phocaeensis]